MNKIPRFCFVLSVFPLDGLTNICDFRKATRYKSGYGYGETAREAITEACKYAYQDCTLWNLPNNPVGYLVEFDEDGNVVNVEQQTLCIVGETTYTLKFSEDDKETFFMASN